MKKNLTNKLMLTAVGLTLSAAAAFAQDHMRADVPFAFETSNTRLAAGAYTMIPMRHIGNAVVTIQNRNTGKTVFTIPVSRMDSSNRAARLVFKCGDHANCALSEAYDGTGNGWKFATPRLSSTEQERLAVIYLHRSDVESGN
jgi:hypothetical protein